MLSVAVLLGAATIAVASPLDLVQRAQACVDGEIITTSTGLQFQVQCGFEAVSRDLGAVTYFDTAAACYDKCATTSGCVGVSWTSGSGTSGAGNAQGGPCYLKSKVINPRSKANARIARAIATFQSCQDYLRDGTDLCTQRVVAPGDCQNFPSGFNDQLSSVKIPAGYSCNFFVDYNCENTSFTLSGTSDVPTDYNDQASSYTCVFSPPTTS